MRAVGCNGLNKHNIQNFPKIRVETRIEGERVKSKHSQCEKFPHLSFTR